MSVKIIHPYITQKEGIQGGKPIIVGTRIPVSSVVAYHKMGDSPEEILEKYPHLTLAQLYDTLSYYYDYHEEIDRDLASDTEERVKDEFGL
jgi:uncharacterized protein (DUF433 family)